jgi:peptidyl-prolyl cis-trans isomerase SurA
VAAIVDGEVISTNELQDRMRLILRSSEIQPTEEVLPQIQAQALEQLIDERERSQKK